MRKRVYRSAYVPKERPKGYAPNFSKYDQMKSTWIANHPAATDEQYRDAIRAIATVCGI